MKSTTLLLLLTLAFGALPASAQAQSPAKRFELSGLAGIGSYTSDEGGKAGLSAFGASLGWRSHSIHGLQVDYVFMDLKSGSRRRFHFVTGSYVVQSRRRRVRPFFQLGAGPGVETVSLRGLTVPRGIPPPSSLRENLLAVVAGAGATVDVSESFFIRPKFAFYAVAGTGFMSLLDITAGWRF